VFYGHGLVLYDFPDLVFFFVCFVLSWKAQIKAAIPSALRCAAQMWNSVIIDGGNVSRLQHHLLESIKKASA
jgi:hypothetical protein